MSEKKISALVSAGNASAGPPLGPQLGPLPVNIGQVVNEINEKTSKFEGMEVPIEVIVDEETGDFEIDVGIPPMASLIREELGIEKGSGEPNKNKVADMSIEQVKNVAEMKIGDLLSSDVKAAAKEVIGSCVSMGVTIDGKDGREVQKLIDKGEYDEKLGDN